MQEGTEPDSRDSSPCLKAGASSLFAVTYTYDLGLTLKAKFRVRGALGEENQLQVETAWLVEAWLIDPQIQDRRYLDLNPWDASAITAVFEEELAKNPELLAAVIARFRGTARTEPARPHDKPRE